MAKLIRLTAKSGKVSSILASRPLKFEKSFVGAKIEIVDAKTGVPLEHLQARVDGEDVILNFADNGSMLEARLEGAAHAMSSFFGISEMSSAEGNSSAVISASSEGSSSESVHDGGLSTGQIALGILGLGALGGIAAAVGGGGGPKDKSAPSAPTGLDLAAADDNGSSNSDNITTSTVPRQHLWHRFEVVI